MYPLLTTDHSSRAVRFQLTEQRFGPNYAIQTTTGVYSKHHEHQMSTSLEASAACQKVSGTTHLCESI